MSDIKSFEPLWGTWQTTKLIGEGSFGKVYRAVKYVSGKPCYAAIKHISIPANESQKNEAIEYGLAGSKSDLSKYFASIAKNLMQEIALMHEVKGNKNIVSYEDHLAVPKPDGIGCDIFIRMELLTGLNEVIRNTSLPESEVIKLGIDMCSALEVCASKNIIHRDIKPANIFVGANGEYKLGDFGIARRLENTTSGMSKKGTYAYMPPEIYHGHPANFTADIYSLGLVMYRLLNDNRAPFMPPYPTPIDATDHEGALLKRITGTPIPPPAHASASLSNIILKATQFDIRKRFCTPGELKSALIQVQNGHPFPSANPLPPIPQSDISSTININSTIYAGAGQPNLPQPVPARIAPNAMPPQAPVFARPLGAAPQIPLYPPNEAPSSNSKKGAALWISIIVALAVIFISVFISCSVCSSYSQDGSDPHFENELVSSADVSVSGTDGYSTDNSQHISVSYGTSTMSMPIENTTTTTNKTTTSTTTSTTKKPTTTTTKKTTTTTKKTTTTTKRTTTTTTTTRRRTTTTTTTTRPTTTTTAKRVYHLTKPNVVLTNASSNGNSRQSVVDQDGNLYSGKITLSSKTGDTLFVRIYTSGNTGGYVISYGLPTPPRSIYVDYSLKLENGQTLYGHFEAHP
ncbi:MAG: protein kinase [Clostridia bacterium]|nr:protein kinase [Clostridia bacterium]